MQTNQLAHCFFPIPIKTLENEKKLFKYFQGIKRKYCLKLVTQGTIWSLTKMMKFFYLRDSI